MTKLAQQDFTIKPPASKTQPQPAPSAPPPPPSSAGEKTSMAAPGGFDAFFPKKPSTTEIAIGAGVFAVLLVLYMFLKLSVTRHLQSRYAAPGAASGAGWSLFVWLAFTTLVLIVVFVGDVWTKWIVTGPAAVVSLILLILFAVGYRRALRTHR